MEETVLKIETYGYLMKHYDVCQDIWKKYVPDTGKAMEMSAELLRQAEFLRTEAMDHENRNWNTECENACDFLLCYLGDDVKGYKTEDKDQIRQIIECIRERGKNKELYKNSVLFDYLEDHIAEMYLQVCEKENWGQNQSKEAVVLARASLVLGIVGLIAWLIPILGLAFTIPGLIFGITASRIEGGKKAKTAIIVCGIGLALALINWGAGIYIAYHARQMYYY